MPQLTPTQRRIIAVLADGKRLTREELSEKAIGDELTDKRTINVHLTALRKKLLPIGQDVVCEYINRTFYYRLVRLTASANDGKR